MSAVLAIAYMLVFGLALGIIGYAISLVADILSEAIEYLCRFEEH